MEGRTITILAWDGKILAADTLTTTGDIKLYHRSKIQIINQTAFCSTGEEEDGFLFADRMRDGTIVDFKPRFDFGVFMLSTTETIMGCGKPTDPMSFWTQRGCSSANGSGDASPYADALMREVKWNAHVAAERAAGYDKNCDLPVYSITQKQLLQIDPDFDGFWIGTYQTSKNQIKKHLITYSQWLKS